MSATETLKNLKDALTAERSASMEKFDKELAQIGSLESSIEAEKEAYGEEIRKEMLAKMDDMDGEGKIHTEADLQALKDEHKAELEKAQADLDAANEAAAKAQTATKAAEEKADRFKKKFETQREAYKSAQERESAIEAEVSQAGADDEAEVETFPTSEVVNEETGEITKR